MPIFRTIAYRFRAFRRKAHLDREADEEMQFHIEMLAKEHERDGMSREAARRRARIEFGGIEKMKENLRETRGTMSVEQFARDIRLAFRQMTKSPGFTLSALATLGIGIGACGAMFSIVNTVLLKPLPFEEPERLLWIQNNIGSGLSAQTTRVDNFLDWRDQNESFESMGGYMAFFDYTSYMLADESGSGSERLRGVGITEGFLETLGVKPMIGRGFLPQELVWQAPPVALLIHDFWQRRFGSDPNIVGKSVTINGEPVEIVGVLPPTFDFDTVFTPGTEVQMLLPFPLVEETNRWGNLLAIIGRLKAGATGEQAQAELEVISERIRAENSNTNRFFHQVNSEPLDDRVRGPFRIAFYVLSGAVACVLAIACVNISNLLIARANGRRKEFAMRSAIGARRSHLIRQTLTESVLLALGGCLIGVPLAYFATSAIAGLQAFSIPMLQMANLDTISVIFVALLACLAGLACGILPALQLSARTPGEALSQRGAKSGRSGLLRKSLVVTEVALACLLLIGAGLLIRSFDRLVNVDLGFDADNAIACRVDGGRPFAGQDERASYFRALAQHVASLPGIESAGLTDTLPLGRNRQWGVSAKEADGQPGPGVGAFPRMVSPGYDRAMGIPLVAGRFFDDFDTSESQFKVVMNEEAAKQLWKDENPIGKIALTSGEEAEVIGVVQNVRHSSLDDAPSPEMYFSMQQLGDYSAVELVVRSKMPPDLLVAQTRAALRGYDESIPTEEFRTLESIVEKSVAPKRLIMNVLTGFSAVALLLASVGLYGVISYSVSQRSKEIGIRMAVGARQNKVMSMVLAEGFGLTGTGVVVGLIVAYAFSRYLSSLLFEVAANDPIIFLTNTSIVALVSLVATIIPARRATAVDPAKALRME